MVHTKKIKSHKKFLPLPDEECLHVRAIVLGEALVLVGECERYLLFAGFVDDVLFVFTGTCLTDSSCRGAWPGRGKEKF